MISVKALSIKLLCLFLLGFPQVALAEKFTAAEVLAWDESAQNKYFHTSVAMIGIVATQTGSHGHIAECLNEWYWEGDGGGVDQRRNDKIREVMEGLPDYHPQAVILAVIEKFCGSFKPD